MHIQVSSWMPCTRTDGFGHPDFRAHPSDRHLRHANTSPHHPAAVSFSPSITVYH
ncbi:hypothetical protein K440DRAFT_613844 [Wilcoxina mikolae CBS 423.85]|nr:hypothetical protein K440DRAFT_613844 [Wilcoxina mikolae CBS 423.85]